MGNMTLNLGDFSYDLSELYSLDDSYFYDAEEKNRKINRIKDNLVAGYNYYANTDIPLDELKKLMDRRLCDQLIDSLVYTMNRLNGRNYYSECREILYAIVNTIMNNKCDLSYNFYDDDLTEGFGKHVYSEMVRLFRGSSDLFKKIFKCNVWEKICGLDERANLNNCTSEEDAGVRKYMCERLLAYESEADTSLSSRINLVDFVFGYHMNYVKNNDKPKTKRKYN